MDIKQMESEKRKVKKGRQTLLSRQLIYPLTFLFFLCSFELYAQNSGYSLDTSGGEPHFIQRLTWTESEYTSRYEIIIEKEEERGYREVRREFTTALFIEVSLVPGKYRCYVTPYDFLGLPGERSQMEIEVLAAFLPELDDSLAEFVYPANVPVYIMNFSGKDMVPGAEIYLLGSEGEHIVPSDILISEDGSEVQLFFNKKQLTSGDYELIIRNPGGLETSKGGITVTRSPAERPNINVFLTVSWMPLSPLYYEEEKYFPGNNLSATGAAARLGVTFTEWNFFNPGLELAASWCIVDASSDGQAQSLVLGLNLLAQKWFPNEKIAFTFRAGAGYTMLLPDWQHIHINMGISFLWVFALNLYMEIGVDYNHWFTESHFGSGCFRPCAGLGWRF